MNEIMTLSVNKLAIIEDDAKIRQYLGEQVELTMSVNQLMLFGNAEDALLSLTQDPADIALFDVQLPGMNGIECIRRLKMIHPRMQCMVLTVYDKPDTVFEALKAGAISYLLKSTPPEKIIEAIEEVFHGGSPISSQIARKVIEAFTQKEKTNDHFQDLTRREQEILGHLSNGYRYKEIADLLFVSIETVRTHIRNIYEKLQVNTRVEALKKTGLL
jgi:DNA-binding NarL/FixJ family response regulator